MPKCSRKKFLLGLLAFAGVATMLLFSRSIVFISLVKVRERTRVLEEQIGQSLGEKPSVTVNELQSLVAKYPQINYLTNDRKLMTPMVVEQLAIAEAAGINGSHWKIGSDGCSYSPGFYVLVRPSKDHFVKEWTVVSVGSGGDVFTGGTPFAFSDRTKRWVPQ